MFKFWRKRKEQAVVGQVANAVRILADFSDLIANDNMGMCFQDVARLPHPKEKIIESFCLILFNFLESEFVDQVHTVAEFITFYQKGIGPRPIYPFGFDPQLSRKDGIRPEQLVDAMKNGKGMAERFKVLETARKAEWRVLRNALIEMQARRAAR